MSSLITAAGCGTIAFFCLIISTVQFMEKGPLLNNAWIWATGEQHKTMNKNPHYRQSGIVFAFLAAIFFSIALECVLAAGWLWLVTGALTVAVTTYAIVSSTRELKH